MIKWVPGGLFSVALSRDRSLWALPSVLPCGARTFLQPCRVWFADPAGASDDLSGSCIINIKYFPELVQVPLQ